jgi:hypothetical protein
LVKLELKLKINNATQLWTSALSSPQCQNTWGWCNENEKEFVDLKALGTPFLEYSDKKECLAADFIQSGSTSNLTFYTDDCKKERNVLCEEVVGFEIKQ